MPHCHVPEEARPPPGFRGGDWRNFAFVLLTLLAVLLAASVAAYGRSWPARPRVDLALGATVYYNDVCSECGPYLADELRPSLEASGVSPIVVKDYGRDSAIRLEMSAVSDGLGIPPNLQGHLRAFVRGEVNLTVFEGHVPPPLILEALTTGNRTDRMLIRQDSMGGAASYIAWGFAGEPQEYAIGTSLAVYTAWYRANGVGSPSPVPLLPLVIATAFVDGLNPCAFAVLLFFVSFLFTARRPRVELARMGAVYIFAVFLAYFLIGLALIAAIQLSDEPHFLARISGFLVAAIGVFVLVQPHLRGVPNPFHTPKFAWERIRKWMLRGTQPAAAVAGFLVGLCTFPCSGGIYVATLGLLSVRASYLEGLGYLYLYNLVFVLPLVIVLLVVSNRHLARAATRWERTHTKRMQQVAGASMVVVGLLTAFLV